MNRYISLAILYLVTVLLIWTGAFIYPGNKGQPVTEPVPVANKSQFVLPASMTCLKCHTNCYNEFPEDLPLFRDLRQPNYDQE